MGIIRTLLCFYSFILVLLIDFENKTNLKIVVFKNLKYALKINMLARQPENFLNRITQALNRPIQSRCAELTVLFDRGSMKDLHTVFPLLIDSIFGPHGTICWDLRSITNVTNPQDFQALQHFLSPLGPMFKLIYFLLRDPLLKFEFSLNYLPGKVRQNIDMASNHPFYADLVHPDHQTNRIISLTLNPFDYYFFHFAYHLINPFHQRFHSTVGSSWSTVYYVLCCDYVLHFLPTDSSCPVSPLLNFYNGKNPIYMLPSFNKPPKSSRLFRSDVVNTSSIQTLEHHPRNEIWRSETIMTVFIDMWLNNDQILSNAQNFDMSLPSCKQKLQMNDIPTGEYIRIIRVLVKQLHAFASSAKVDDTHMGELKKIVIPYLQGRMYIFLRHLVHRWPLDGSFRLVLELWLSFLQPWRYPGNDFIKLTNQVEINRDLEDISAAPMKAVDRENMQFMAENLLAYTVILQQLLPRFTRADLSSPKIALILYRLTKVFGQPHLVSYLREIESSTEFINTSPIRSYNANFSNGLPPLSPTSMWSTNTSQNYNTSSVTNKLKENLQNSSRNGSFYDSKFGTSGKWLSIIKQKILEYEGPNFHYKPIFYAPTAPEVYELLSHIKKAEEIAQVNIQSRLDEMKQQSRGILGFLKSVFLIPENSPDEFSLEERKKVPMYLQNSLKHLTEVFKVTESNYTLKQSDEDPRAKVVTFANNINSLLTPQRVRERVKSIKYEGDPDLHPIRSDEVKVLVRLLYQASLKINENFGPQIRELYYKDNFFGRLSHNLLASPMRIYKYDKSFPGVSPRIPENLPPRVSLRFFANKKFLFYLIVIVITSKLLGYGYLTLFCIIFIFWLLYICLKTFCGQRQIDFAIQTDNSMDVDYSGNESF